jgi:hypothetical protein
VEATIMTREVWESLLAEYDSPDYWLVRTQFADWLEERGEPEHRAWRKVMDMGWRPCDCTDYSTQAVKYYSTNTDPSILERHNKWVWFNRATNPSKCGYYIVAEFSGKLPENSILPKGVHPEPCHKLHDSFREAEDWLIRMLLIRG